MKIEMKSISFLHGYSKNAKIHDNRQIKNVANSIQRYGFRQPIVITVDGEIVIGECRFQAAKYLGMNEVPCVVADNLTEEEIRELRIVDNKTNESPWDYELLETDREGLDFEGFDLDFSSLDGDSADYDPEEEPPEVEEDEVPPEFKEFTEEMAVKWICPECGYEWN